MLKNKELGIEDIEISKEIEINICITKINIRIKITITKQPITIKRIICASTIINKEDNIKDDDDSKEHIIRNR